MPQSAGFADAIRLRRHDDTAKAPVGDASGLAEHRAMLRSLIKARLMG